MRTLLSICLLLMSSAVFAQNSFSFQELLDIYLAKDKTKAIQAVESKGYAPANADDVNKNAVLYSREHDESKVTLIFLNSRLSHVILIDSIKNISKLLDELEMLTFELVNQDGDISKAYVKSKTNYFVYYEIKDNTKSLANLYILPKDKGNKTHYKLK